jgi:hypothetical protein
MTEGMDGWSQYRLLVIEALERLERQIDALRADLAATRKEIGESRRENAVDIATLKAKSSVWGALGGALVSSLAALAWQLAK